MLKALRMIGVALVFAAAIIGASWGTKGLWYQDYVDMGIYAAFAVWLSCEAACGGCCGNRKRAMNSCK